MVGETTLIWDETFPSLLLKGEGTLSFLHGQTTADVFAQKQSDRIFLSCWLSTRGNLKALLEIKLIKSMAQVVIISGEINSVRDGFESVIFPADKVSLEVVKPIRRIQKINNFHSWKTSHCSWLDDNELITKEISNYTRATEEELTLWKIRQGIPSIAKEINGETNPYQLGLADTINLDKGCYLGQEAIARLARSQSLTYQLRYWESCGGDNNFFIGKKFLHINKHEGLRKKVGVVTSFIRTNDDCFHGLALIKNDFIDNDIFISDKDESITIKKPISFTHPF